MEAAHTHPVVLVFVRLLAALKNERKLKENKTSEIYLGSPDSVPGRDTGYTIDDRGLSRCQRFLELRSYELII